MFDSYLNDHPAVIALLIVGPGALMIIWALITHTRDERRRCREREERKARGEKVYDSVSEFVTDVGNWIKKSSQDLSEAFQRDWKADRFPPHVLIEQNVVLTYRFDGTKRPQPQLVASGFAQHIGAIFEGKSEKSDDGGFYGVVDEKFREIIRANPNADFTKFEDAYSVKIIDVQRKHQLQSGIYVGQ